jgi:hypothetical protein
VPCLPIEQTWLVPVRRWRWSEATERWLLEKRHSALVAFPLHAMTVAGWLPVERWLSADAAPATGSREGMQSVAVRLEEEEAALGMPVPCH